MEMSNIRAESHVAQQSRRDKLRIQQTSDPAQHHLGDFSNNLEQLPVHHPGLSPDLMQVRNVRNANLLYNPGLISSEMLNYSTNSNNLAVLKDIMVNQELGAAQRDTHVEAVDAPFTNSSHPVCTSSNNKATRNMQNFGIWRSLGSQQSCDWIANYASGSAVTGSHQNPMIVEDLSNSMKVNNMSPSIPYFKPSNGFLDVQSTLTNPSSEISNREIQEHWKEMHFGSRLYQSTLQEVVTSGKIVQNGETGRNSWAGGGNELVLLPQFENESNALRVSYASALMNRPVVACLQPSDPSRSIANKNDGNSRTVASDANTQALSLSLSSEGQFCERYGTEALPSRTDIPQDVKTTKSGYLCSNSKSIMSNKGYGNSPQDITGTSYTRQHAGPLGPFTGYATILKSSKFLRPAQQLLVEFCSVADPNFFKKCELSERISGEVSGGMAVNAAENEVGIKGGNSAVSSSTFHSSNEVSGEVGVGSCSSESNRPEYQQKKAKLLFMQEEVCRRYKHYHQQMQMVVSSFESVAGLSAATPYISFALKAVSRHFRSLKNAISDQLRDIKKALGEDLSSPTTGTSSSRGDITTSKLKFIDHGFPKHKYGGSNMGFLESQQHIWRPQRGLPERAVAVLRAWLFEHFLHPYPTDTDKHMLATQTGLTRNQVSNWFINARVRVWKPMVEEIHMLETKGLAETDVHSGKNDRATVTEGTKWPNGDHPIDEIRMNAISDKKWERSGLGNSSVGTGDELGVEWWDQEKRSRVEGHIPGGMDGSGSLMSFVPYHRDGLEIGGLGTVSLTLGLRQSAERHSVETAQQPQPLPQGHHLRQHFGGQMIHDFVG